MSFTREQVETLLIKRVGRLMTAASLDGETHDGSNEDLNDPIGLALRQLDCTVADPTEVSDDDLANVADDQLDELLDQAELRALQNVQGNLALVDITSGPRSERLGQLASQVKAMIDQKQSLLDANYGTSNQLEAGVITLSFAEHNDA